MLVDGPDTSRLCDVRRGDAGVDRECEMTWKQVVPVLNPSVRGLCTRPYPGHPRGCPNHGKRDTCPPAAPLLGEYYDLSRAVWVIWNRFPFGEHVARMQAKHPDWSDRQLACCLYWQGTARKQLEETIAMFTMAVGALSVTRCPEAMGVDVTATMASLGISLEWPPGQWAYQVALAGAGASPEQSR